MKRLFVIFGTAGLLLSSVLVGQATAALSDEDMEKINGARSSSTVRPLLAAGNAQTAVGTAQCFTCGGDWPVFVGSWNVPFATNNVTERGSSCSGASTARTDTRPFLCGR